MNLARIAMLAVLAIAASPAMAEETGKGHPLTAKRRAELTRKFTAVVEKQTKNIAENPNSIRSYSSRGDAYLFLGQYKESVADYEKMVKLNPKLSASHWRRGIAYFYAGQYKQAAAQFEAYKSYDNVDRENGIWRFFSQAKAYGIEKARKNLLKYKTTDREPFGDVYKLFSKQIKPERILANIAAAKVGKSEREKRYFYAHLYIGLNHALEGNTKPALEQLRKSTANSWGPDAGFGPNYMWHVGRLHHDMLGRK